MNREIYYLFWVYLAYFIAFVFLVVGYHNHWQSWIYYGLFMVMIGLWLGISTRLLFIEDLLTGAEIEYRLKDDYKDD